MIVDVDGHSSHAGTGGVELSGDEPVMILIHGAGMDSTVWQLQTRFLAHRGLRAVAVDLPGHGRSDGPPLTSIADMAEWLMRFLTAAGFSRPVHLVGHSMGTFVALHLAAHHPDRVASAVLLGTADSMAVHPDLVTAAAEDLPAAAALMAAWGHDKFAHVGLNPTPGQWMLGGARALVENSAPGVLAADFAACVSFDDAEENARRLQCPVTVVIGTGDKMTPPRAGRTVAAWIRDARVVELPRTGHSMMIENPRAIRSLLLATATN
jgi:pimeloyl-ACP methyl ester carboxylesterase